MRKFRGKGKLDQSYRVGQFSCGGLVFGSRLPRSRAHLRAEGRMNSPMFEIKNRWNQVVIYKSDVANSAAEAVIEAVTAGQSLTEADLSGVVFPVDASLVGASLVGASLDRARLDPIRDDFWAVLSEAPLEVRGLLAELRKGKIRPGHTPASSQVAALTEAWTLELFEFSYPVVGEDREAE